MAFSWETDFLIGTGAAEDSYGLLFFLVKAIIDTLGTVLPLLEPVLQIQRNPEVMVVSLTRSTPFLVPRAGLAGGRGDRKAAATNTAGRADRATLPLNMEKGLRMWEPQRHSTPLTLSSRVSNLGGQVSKDSWLPEPARV